MRYLGSKTKIASQLLKSILDVPESYKKWYIEPFAGGCNVIDKVGGMNRIANDNNYYLIEMWKSLQNGWVPFSDISKEEYYCVKENIDIYPPEYAGFIGHACSFSGGWWNGYITKNNPATIIAEALIKQAQLLKDVQFFYGNYFELKIPENSIIYCDPPYSGVKDFSWLKFDHIYFWNWVRKMNELGHKIFVSEYTAPADFEAILEIPVKITLGNKNKGDKVQEKIERLFIKRS